MYEELNRTSIPINISDMIVSEQGQISTEERNKIIINKLNQFKSSKIVITARLHGMIFSALTEIPCIVFFNNNRFNNRCLMSSEKSQLSVGSLRFSIF